MHNKYDIKYELDGGKNYNLFGKKKKKTVRVGLQVSNHILAGGTCGLSLKLD